jgi:hypothetical protein
LKHDSPDTGRAKICPAHHHLLSAQTTNDLVMTVVERIMVADFKLTPTDGKNNNAQQDGKTAAKTSSAHRYNSK